MAFSSYNNPGNGTCITTWDKLYTRNSGHIDLVMVVLLKPDLWEPQFSYVIEVSVACWFDAPPCRDRRSTCAYLSQIHIEWSQHYLMSEIIKITDYPFMINGKSVILMICGRYIISKWTKRVPGRLFVTGGHHSSLWRPSSSNGTPSPKGGALEKIVLNGDRSLCQCAMHLSEHHLKLGPYISQKYHSSFLLISIPHISINLGLTYQSDKHNYPINCPWVCPYPWAIWSYSSYYSKYL